MSLPKNPLLSAVALVAALVSAPAMAQFDPGPPPPPPPEGGRPAQRSTETPAQLGAVFDAADRDHNGQLDRDEYRTSISQALLTISDVVFGARDRDGDGLLSRTEYTTFGFELPGAGERPSPPAPPPPNAGGPRP